MPLKSKAQHTKVNLLLGEYILQAGDWLKDLGQWQSANLWLPHGGENQSSSSGPEAWLFNKPIQTSSIKARQTKVFKKIFYKSSSRAWVCFMSISPITCFVFYNRNPQCKSAHWRKTIVHSAKRSKWAKAVSTRKWVFLFFVHFLLCFSIETPNVTFSTLKEDNCAQCKKV